MGSRWIASETSAMNFVVSARSGSRQCCFWRLRLVGQEDARSNGVFILAQTESGESLKTRLERSNVIVTQGGFLYSFASVGGARHACDVA